MSWLTKKGGKAAADAATAHRPALSPKWRAEKIGGTDAAIDGATPRYHFLKKHHIYSGVPDLRASKLVRENGPQDGYIRLGTGA